MRRAESVLYERQAYLSFVLLYLERFVCTRFFFYFIIPFSVRLVNKKLSKANIFRR